MYYVFFQVYCVTASLVREKWVDLRIEIVCIKGQKIMRCCALDQVRWMSFCAIGEVCANWVMHRSLVSCVWRVTMDQSVRGRALFCAWKSVLCDGFTSTCEIGKLIQKLWLMCVLKCMSKLTNVSCVWSMEKDGLSEKWLPTCDENHVTYWVTKC